MFQFNRKCDARYTAIKTSHMIPILNAYIPVTVKRHYLAMMINCYEVYMNHERTNKEQMHTHFTYFLYLFHFKGCTLS